MIGFALALWEIAILRAGGVTTPTGNGQMDFSIATGDDTGLLVLLDDF